MRLFCIQDLQKQIETEPIAWKLTWGHKCDIIQNHNVLLKMALWFLLSRELILKLKPSSGNLTMI